MIFAKYMRNNGMVGGDWRSTELSIQRIYEDVVGYDTGTTTGVIEWADSADYSLTMKNHSIYAKLANSSGSSASVWYGGDCADTQWIKIENGWEHFGKPCKTAALEWRLVYDDSTTTSCTGWTTGVKYKYGWIDHDGYIQSKPLTPEQQAERAKRQLKDILRTRQAPMIMTNYRERNPLKYAQDVREERARETLRRVIGEEKYRYYVQNGFITVKGKTSGLTYQIFPGHGITCVFDRGKMVDRLCVVLRGNFPPTDSLIMRYLMILNNEAQFRSYAIKHGVFERSSAKIVTPDQRPLPEIFREIKNKLKVA